MELRKIGPTFAAELEAAGLIGLPFSWSDDGRLTFGKELTDDHIEAVEAVYARHDPAARPSS